MLIKAITKCFITTGNYLLQVTKTHGRCVYCSLCKECFHQVGNGPNRQHVLWLPFNNFHKTVIFTVCCQIPKLSFEYFQQNYSHILSCYIELIFLPYLLQAFSYKWEYSVTINLFAFIATFLILRSVWGHGLLWGLTCQQLLSVALKSVLQDDV